MLTHRVTHIFTFFALILVSAWTYPVCADELDSLLGGFDEETPETTNELDKLIEGFEDSAEVTEERDSETAPVLPGWLALQGSVSLQSTLNFAHNAPEPGMPDYRGLSMFRGHGEVIADMSFGDVRARIGATAFYDAAYYLNDQRDLYTREYLSEYENEIELNEAYLQGSLADNIDLKFGRQIVVWGKSDNLRVTDILNPLDRRYPGMLDIRYLRLPVTMTKLDYYWGNWNINGILLHEPRFDKLPRYNGEFYPGTQPLPPIDTPELSFDNQQAAFALNGIFSGWDLSFYAANVFEERAYIDANPVGLSYRKHDRATMVGAAVNFAFGNWLLKGEAAYWDNLRYTNTDEEKPRFDILAGVEYMGFRETAISLELANRHILDYDPVLGFPPDGQKEDWQQMAFRFTKDFLNDTLHLTFVFSSFGLLGAEGGFERFQLDYDLSDNLTLTGGLVLYESGDYPGFDSIGSNDRILFELEYRF